MMLISKIAIVAHITCFFNEYSNLPVPDWFQQEHRPHQKQSWHRYYNQHLVVKTEELVAD